MTVGRRPSQRDIAERAQVSQTAVSMVLNGKTTQHGIAKETEARVRAAMDELGYIPNVAARTLRQGRNGLIGVHTFEAMFPTDQNSYYYEFMVGVEEKAIELGQDLVLLTSAHQQPGDHGIYHRGTNRLRLTDGAVILGFNQDDDELTRLAAEGFPFVFIGRRERAATLMPYVTVDYDAAMATVVESLAAHGHHRVAYLGLGLRLEPRVERVEAFRTSAAAAGLHLVEEVLAAPAGLPADWLATARADGVTAVIVEGPSHLPGLVAQIERAGIDIPVDLSVVCLDVPGRRDASHDWTHTVIPRRSMGNRAVGVLLDLLDARCPTDHAEALPCPLHRGETLGRAPGQ